MPAPAVRARPARTRGGTIRYNAGTYVTAQLTNTFEGGTSGTTITQSVNGNSGGASGNFFDTVSIGGGATDAADNTHAAHGTLSAKIATAG